MTSCHGAYYDGVLRIICTGSPQVVLIAGEIDQARYLGLVSTLEDLVDPEGAVHVNLAELAYCDVAGLRAILRLAGTGREDQGHDRSLFLDDVPPHLATLLRILGWDSAPGLNMTEAAQPTAGASGMAPAGLVSGDAGHGIGVVGQRSRIRLMQRGKVR
jgi:ABC-type transporter Mla MlaB component